MGSLYIISNSVSFLVTDLFSSFLFKPVQSFAFFWKFIHFICFLIYWQKIVHKDFPGGAVVKNPPANAGDTVQALVREDPTCHRETRPACLEPVLRNKRRHRNEKPVHHNEE